MRSNPDEPRPGRRVAAAIAIALLGCGGESPPAPPLTSEPGLVEPTTVAAPVIDPEPEPIAPTVASPPPVMAPPPPKLVLSETRGCVIAANGAVYCFAIGGRPPVPDAFATAISGLNDAVTLAADDSNVCIVSSSGEVTCVATRQAAGTWTLLPAQLVPSLRGAQRLALRSEGACALDDAGGVHCAPYAGGAAVAIDLPGPAVDIASSGYETCAALAGGVHCWGRTRPPYRVETRLNGVRAVGVAGDATCALGALGTDATCYGQVGSWYFEDFEWEDEERGPVNAMEAPVSPGAMVPLLGVTLAVSTAMDHGCALSETGGVSCWGGAFRTGRHEGFEPRAVRGMASGVTEIAGGGGP